MNLFRILGDLSHLVSIFILLQKMRSTRSCAGISLRTQILYLMVYCTRYLDIFWTFNASLYNSSMKLVFILSTAYTIYLMRTVYKTALDPQIDTFATYYLVGGAGLLAVLFPYKYTVYEVLWSFSIWLESVAILPQLFMLQRTGEAETITTHYLFALGAYRALYIPNWLYRWFLEGHFDPIATVAGIIQTLLYSDFFYIYYTKVLKGKKFELPV
ncbi:ER lumen protein retaining receptor [Ascobolus immersus RN42]|uniref:ER lumen protein-retaining receptor n=1 Tax=Ascobolus immersus RN42 TaxID=1160509 RepID=A0A3N4I6T3_ASCIM|nr:ER lumen protein retaining receptor [Ascobolus immersus RN42]